MFALRKADDASTLIVRARPLAGRDILFELILHTKLQGDFPVFLVHNFVY